MIKHYVKVALRLIKRSALFSSINMLGFVFGMTAAFLIYLWVVNELTYDDCFPDSDRIYRTVEISREPSGEIKESVSTLRPLAKIFKEEFPQIEDAVAVKYETAITLETEQNKAITGDLLYADQNFFNLFPMKVVAGNPKEIDKTVENIVLSKPMAFKLFGKQSAIGQKVVRRMARNNTIFTVVAVVDIPSKSHIQFDILAPIDGYGGGWMSMDWNKFREHISVYVKMKPGEAGKMQSNDQQAMSRALTKMGEKQPLIRFQPIRDVHLKTTFVDPKVKNHGSMATVYLFIALAVVVIFMGAFNFMTLSTARASIRYKEIGVRKVTGAKRRTLIVQFLSESLIQAIISLVLALVFTELLLPLFNRMMNTEISLHLSWSVFFYILFGIIGVGCLAGSYPAFYLSSINPLLAFKGGIKTGKKGGLIKGLVCVQFVIAITLMLITCIVIKQLHYMKNKDLGLDKENVISIYTNLWYDTAEFKQELLKNPNVLSVSMGAPINSYMEDVQLKDGETSYWSDPSGKEDSLKMVPVCMDADFIKTYGLKIIKGGITEDFNKYWDNNGSFSVLINEAAWKVLKVADPVGMALEVRKPGWVMHLNVIGVVKDFNFQSLREKVKPAYLMYNPEWLVDMHIKIAPEKKQETIKYIQKKFQEMSGDLFIKEFKYQFFSDALNKNYEKEQQQSDTLLGFTILAIIIAMMGVFGLVTLSTEQRTKEIGIRKVNGAHSDRIVKMFCMEYLRWVGIAFVIACTLGYLLMSHWLNTFAYQTPISWWLFALAGLLIGGITLITVISQTWRKASQNPVKSLRYE